MSLWSVAHRKAQIGAVHASHDFGMDAEVRVDVFAGVQRAGLCLAAMPQAKLFGAYLPATPNSDGGVLLNSRLDLTTQRHTAAHELGHHVMLHGQRMDLSLDPNPGPGVDRLTEAEAEAFAAWLLMPPRTMRVALNRLGLHGVATPLHVYAMALLLGTSYRGTARHLPHARVPHKPQMTRAARPPATIKDSLDEPSAPPRAPRRDVWPLHIFAAAGTIVVQPGDRLTAPTAGDCAETLAGWPAGQVVAETQDRMVFDVHPEAPPSEVVISGARPDVDTQLHIVVEPPLWGEASAACHLQPPARTVRGLS